MTPLSADERIGRRAEAAPVFPGHANALTHEEPVSGESGAGPKAAPVFPGHANALTHEGRTTQDAGFRSGENPTSAGRERFEAPPRLGVMRGRVCEFRIVRSYIMTAMYRILLLASVLLLGACGGNAQKKSAGDRREAEKTAPVPDMHTAETSLDYVGTYTGTFPAADCPGIETELNLSSDGTFALSASYIDRDATFYDEGTYTVDGSLLTLNGLDEVSYYKVEENRLRKLDAGRQAITGDLADCYILKKTN